MAAPTSEPRPDARALLTEIAARLARIERAVEAGAVMDAAELRLRLAALSHDADRIAAATAGLRAAIDEVLASMASPSPESAPLAGSGPRRPTATTGPRRPPRT